MSLLTYTEFLEAVNRLPRRFIGPTQSAGMNHMARPVEPGDDPNQQWVKLVDAQILWSRVTVPPVVHLLTDITDALRAHHKDGAAPYATLERIESALEDYAENTKDAEDEHQQTERA